jgi:hypothetical protein
LTALDDCSPLPTALDDLPHRLRAARVRAERIIKKLQVQSNDAVIPPRLVLKLESVPCLPQ